MQNDQIHGLYIVCLPRWGLWGRDVGRGRRVVAPEVPEEAGNDHVEGIALLNQTPPHFGQGARFRGKNKTQFWTTEKHGGAFSFTVWGGGLSLRSVGEMSLAGGKSLQAGCSPTKGFGGGG